MKSIQKKHLGNKGFLLLNAMFASLLIIVPLTMLIGLLAKANLRLTQLQNLANSGKLISIAGPGQTCSSPKLCMTTQINNKEVQICDGNCSLISGQWYLNTTHCDKGVICN